MPGVYIPGMEMPTEGMVLVIYKIDGKFFAGDSLCPLVPVPDHGDLIERDALLEHEWEAFRDDEDNVLFGVRTANILRAPTIIPTDKEGET